jgi:hypothetical protein
MRQIEITEVVNHPDFVKNIREQLNGIEADRERQRQEFRTNPQNFILGDLNFKRSPIETLPEKGIYTGDMPKAYLEVLAEKSTLSARERSFVKFIGYKALVKTYHEHFKD